MLKSIRKLQAEVRALKLAAADIGDYAFSSSWWHSITRSSS